MGRDFNAEDDKPGAEKVAILGHEVWKRDFDGDPNIVGQSVRINGKAATVIGVMPPNFKFPVSEELWVPYYNEFPLRPRGAPIFGAGNSAPAIMGRLKSDVTLDQVNAEFVGLSRRLRLRAGLWVFLFAQSVTAEANESGLAARHART